MIVISNGFNKFSLAEGASEGYRRQELSLYLTGAYPSTGISRAITRLGLQPHRKLGRLLARQTDVPDTMVRSFWWPEVFNFIGLTVSDNRSHGHSIRSKLAEQLAVFAMRRYGQASLRALQDPAVEADIYFFRSGFGGPSIQQAKKKNMIALCYHSIAHPEVLGYTLKHDGALPPPGAPLQVSGIWREVLNDLNASDFVVTQGNYVKDTFLNRGWSDSRLFPVFQGVDDLFLELLETARAASEDSQALSGPEGPLRLVFAGSGARKGVQHVLEALRHVTGDAWSLEIFGSIPDDIAETYRRELADPRVRYLGLLPRSAVAAGMLSADVFVLPSLAEGSVKVVFEALAAGCYAIVTPNCGSIVQDGIHGELVSPADPRAIARAIDHCIESYQLVKEIGRKNSVCVMREFRQSGFGEQLSDIYQEVRTRSLDVDGR